jgi:glycosyltransferase involved in cell wall biosynthesis
MIYKKKICCFVYDVPNSLSGPNKSIKLIRSKIFKGKKNFITFFKYPNKNKYYLDGKILNYIDIIRCIKKSDIIYLNGIYSFTHFIVPLTLAINFKKKIIISPRGMLGEEAFIKSKYKKIFFIKFFNFIFHNLNHKISMHATSTKEKVDIKLKINCKPKQIALLSNLNDTKRISNKNYKKKNEIKFFYFSNITSKKNLLHFFKAMHLTNLPYDKISLHIYGKIIDKNYYEKLLKYKKEYKLNIDFKGEIPNNRIRLLQKKYHFLAHMSHGENYGHTIVECLSMGVPCIIGDNTPWSNYDKNFVGLVHPTFLVKQLSRSLIELYHMNNKNYQNLRKLSLDYFINNIKSNEIKNINLYKKLFLN